MKRSRLLAAVLCSAMVIGGASFPVMADATKVVTLGADLNDSQKQTMMSYFKANPNEVQIIYVTNQDERNHLGSYIPLSQIGTRTLSCAYVKPTQSGGIRVRTANLNYVTGNMIASSLSTSGIANCEVIAACPFEVSGTGALTGIQMAYESASGKTLDPVKKDLAAKEIVVTQNVASTCGNNNATRLINSAKLEVIQNNVQNTNEIYNIVNNICIQNNINITQNNITEVVELLEDISQEDYAIEDVEETLINVDENVANVEAYENEDVEAVTEPAPEPEYDADSILNDIDETILGTDVPTSSTEDASLEAETYDEQAEQGTQTPSGEENRPVDEFGIPEGEETVFNPDGTETPVQTDGQPDSGESVEFIPADGTTGDGTETNTTDVAEPEDQKEDESFWDTIFGGGSDSDSASQNADEGGQTGDDTAVPAETDTTAPAAGTDTSVTAEDPAQQLLAKLSAEETTRYQSAKDFFKGEFEGDKDALTRAMGAAFVPSYTFSSEDKDSAAKLSKAITDKYLSVLAAESPMFRTAARNISTKNSIR